MKKESAGNRSGFVRSKLLPDYYFDNIYQITPELLLSHSIKAVVLDIDNTLVTYDDEMPTEPVLKWLGKLENAGIKAAFVSNNKEKRVSLFNSKLGYFHSSKSRKPSVTQTENAMKYMGSDKTDTAAIGDQIFTDVITAKRLGLLTFLVKPIKDKKSPFFRFKRFFERIILKKYLYLIKLSPDQNIK